MQIFCSNKKKATVTLVNGNQKIISDNCPIGVELKNVNLEECILYRVKAYITTHHLTFESPCPGSSRFTQTLFFEGEVRGRARPLVIVGCESMAGGYFASSLQYATFPFMGKMTDCVTDYIYRIPVVGYDPFPHVTSDITNSGNHYNFDAGVTSVEVIEGVRKNRVTEIKIYDSTDAQGNKTTNPTKLIYSGTIENPNDYHVTCGEDCPPGTTKCHSDLYPGYCCLPCDSTKQDIISIKNQVKKVNKKPVSYG